jgi:hypothetical protein
MSSDEKAVKKNKKAAKTYEVKVYKTDGQTDVFTGTKDFFDLDWLQKKVGGDIETLPGIKGHSLVFNEAGLLLHLPDNFQMSILYPALVKRVFNGRRHFKGDVLLVPNRLL